MKLSFLITSKSPDQIPPLRSAPISLSNAKINLPYLFFLLERLIHFTQYSISWMLRRKYEMLQFSDGNEQMICPYPPHQRSSSSSTPQSSSGHQFTQDKKQYEKQPRHRIGHKFRNSWGRKDSDHNKSTKKSNSLVIIFVWSVLIMTCWFWNHL